MSEKIKALGVELTLLNRENKEQSNPTTNGLHVAWDIIIDFMIIEYVHDKGVQHVGQIRSRGR